MAVGKRAAQDVGMVLIYGDPIDPNKNANEKELGARLRAWRERLGQTQEELAAKSGLASDTIRRAEHGSFSPSYRTLRKIAEGFGVHVSALLRDDADQADELAECIRALPEHEFRIACAMVKVLSRLAAGHASGDV